MKKKIAILGSTGSIGKSTIKIIKKNRSDFEVVLLSTNKNINEIHKFSGLLDLPLINFFRNIFIKNTKYRSKLNIAKHYDLGNEFFSLWLDKTLTYSSAIFDKKSENLSDAQNNKYQKLIDLIQPKNGDRVLEIGCGWGGFAEYFGKKYDVKLDCITFQKNNMNMPNKEFINVV